MENCKLGFSWRQIMALFAAGIVLVLALGFQATSQEDTKPKAGAKKGAAKGSKKPLPEIVVEGLDDRDDLDAIEGKVVRMDMERDTEADLPTVKVLELSRDPKTKKVRALKIEVASRPAKTILLSAVKRIRVGRKIVYESAKGSKESEERAEWIARAKKNGVTPWAELAPEEHQAAIKKHKEDMERVKESFPDLMLYETQEFLFFTDLPGDRAAPLAKGLDAMHETMCKLYGIKKGTPVWKGKCLVVLFRERSGWDSYQEKIVGVPPRRGMVFAVCRSRSDGFVRVDGCCAESPFDVAATLVHESSHGFVFRWRTPVRLPAWISEGLADFVAVTLVPSAKGITNREPLFLAELKSKRRLEEKFFDASALTRDLDYGVALGIARFLQKKNPKAFVAFLNTLKVGVAWEASLKEHFQMTRQQLVTAYGQSIGVPDLKE